MVALSTDLWQRIVDAYKGTRCVSRRRFPQRAWLALFTRARIPQRTLPIALWPAESRSDRTPARASGSLPLAWGLLLGAPTLTETGLAQAGSAQPEAGCASPFGDGAPASSRRTMPSSLCPELPSRRTREAANIALEFSYTKRAPPDPCLAPEYLVVIDNVGFNHRRWSIIIP